MTPTELLQIWPSQAEIARRLRIKQPSVFEWFEAGAIPFLRQCHIQVVSRGRLKVDQMALRYGVKRAA